MTEKLTQLLNKLDQEKQILQNLQQLLADAGAALQADSSVKNKRRRDAAQKALDKGTDQLWQKLMHVEPAFDNRMDVLRHLQAEGYKVEKSKLYKDAQDGILPVQPDGSVWKVSVATYKHTLDLLSRLEANSKDAADQKLDKLTKEVERLGADTDLKIFDLQKKRGEHYPKDLVLAALSELLNTARKAFQLLPKALPVEMQQEVDPRIDDILKGLERGASLSELEHRLQPRA